MKVFVNLHLNRTSKLIITLLIAIGLPLSVFLSLRQAEIRQRAAGEQTAMYFNSSLDDSIGVAEGNSVVFPLIIDTRGVQVNGYDVMFYVANGNSNIAIGKIEDGVDSPKFDTTVFNENQDGVVRLSKIITKKNQFISGKLEIAKITFNGIQFGSGSIVFTKTIVSSPNLTSLATVELGKNIYSVSKIFTDKDSYPAQCTVVAGEGNSIRGWALDQDSIDQTLLVKLYLDGNFDRDIFANTYLEIFSDPYQKRHGFIREPYTNLSIGSHTITAKAQGVKENGSLGPLVDCAGSITLTVEQITPTPTQPQCTNDYQCGRYQNCVSGKCLDKYCDTEEDCFYEVACTNHKCGG